MGFPEPVRRKPVQRRTVSEGSPLRVSPPFRHILDRVASANMLAPPRPRALTSTGLLLSEASRSLTSLVQNVPAEVMRDHAESPPPYVDLHPDATYTSDVKVRENGVQLSRTIEALRNGINDANSNGRTALMEAAELGRTNDVEALINGGCQLHVKDVDGNSALHFAAIRGDTGICRMLLDAGAHLDEYNATGESPLALAARYGHTETVQCLLNSWTAQRISGTALMNGFFEASKSGNVSTAEAFVERGIKPKKIKEQWRILSYAAQSGSIPMIDFLIAQKVNLKARSPDRWTALHFAASRGHTAMVEKLLDWKLSWKAQTSKTEETALHLAILAKHNPTALALILHKDANVTMKDADGVQPLHHAIRNGDLALTSALLDRGAKLQDQTKYGFTSMLLACAYGHLPLVAEFITRGASLEDKTNNPSFKPSKKTNEAARKGYWAEIRWPHQSARPLHLALEFSHDEVANTLIAAGASIHESDSAGWRPLHHAAFAARWQMVDLLLGKGASPHVTTDDGNTPLSLGLRESGVLANEEEKRHIVEILQVAMNARKKSKLKQLTAYVTSGSNKSREVNERNRVWHAAELASMLYQTDQVDDEPGEDASQLTTTPSNQSLMDEDDYDTPRAKNGLPRIMTTETLDE